MSCHLQLIYKKQREERGAFHCSELLPLQLHTHIHTHTHTHRVREREKERDE